PELGGYTIFTLNGSAVAGGAPLMSEDKAIPWSSYVIVVGAAATTTRVVPARGRGLGGPMGGSRRGRKARYVRPTGGATARGQAGERKGGAVFNVPGALSWNELVTGDLETAKAFYGTVFGWESTDSTRGDIAYVQWELGRRGIAGMSPMVGERFPEDHSPHWA